MQSEYEYVMSIGNKLGDYVGQWIAVVGEKIVAHGADGREVYKRAKEKHPDRIPFIMKVPAETVMLL